MKELCYSSDDEIFENDLFMVLDSVIDNCEKIEEAREAIIYQAELIRPKIKAEELFRFLQEQTEECVYDQCGEYADRFCAKTNYDLALKTHLQQWIDRLNINCYTVVNSEAIPLTDFMTEDELIELFNGEGNDTKNN